jgi:hypothetical protein
LSAKSKGGEILAITQERRKEKAREVRTALYTLVFISGALEAYINGIVDGGQARLVQCLLIRGVI